jgi:hypothetical protein
VKDYYKCKFKSCSKQCYIEYNDVDVKVSVMMSVLEHEHIVLDERKWGINDVTKHEIRRLFSCGVKFPKSIQYALREMTDETHINYVQGIVVPSRLMISNFVNNTVKPKIIKPKFSYGDLVAWIDLHSTVPVAEHDPFVCHSFVEVNEKVPSASVISFYLPCL